MLLNNGKKRIPIGYEDFKQLLDGDFYYVDKSMLIYELLHYGGQNNLITRPRRFGKTLNISMLRYFFDITEKDNQYLFDDLKISEYYKELAMYRNTHPVISLSLKCAKRGNYNSAIYSLRNEIQSQFKKHRYVLKSDKIDADDKKQIEEIMKPDADANTLSGSIKLLSSCLKQYYGTNVIILIDEYDVPLEDAYFSNYYDDMLRFIRSLFESALKTNPALEFSVITGCLRISKESIFTGLNNLRVNSILSKVYSECFGFIQSEIDELLDYYELNDKKPIMKEWFDGYLFGKSDVYNPWSTLNQIAEWTTNSDASATPWWANTSSNNIIKTLIEHADVNTKVVIENLMQGGTIETAIKETITYGDLTHGNENIWSFLLFTGYLKIKEVVKTGESTGDATVYSLIIPNLEIKSCYVDIIVQYFEKYKRTVNKDDLYRSLLNHDPSGFAQQVTSLLQKSISYFDNTEAFYHGLVSGLLSGNPIYKLESNRETGNGRSDLIIYQSDMFINAIIMEFKVCKEDEEIDKIAQKALSQIISRDYSAEVRNRRYKHIFRYGIAFKDKSCYAVLDYQENI